MDKEEMMGIGNGAETGGPPVPPGEGKESDQVNDLGMAREMAEAEDQIRGNEGEMIKVADELGKDIGEQVRLEISGNREKAARAAEETQERYADAMGIAQELIKDAILKGDSTKNGLELKGIMEEVHDALTDILLRENPVGSGKWKLRPDFEMTRDSDIDGGFIEIKYTGEKH